MEGRIPITHASDERRARRKSDEEEDEKDEDNEDEDEDGDIGGSRRGEWRRRMELENGGGDGGEWRRIPKAQKRREEPPSFQLRSAKG